MASRARNYSQCEFARGANRSANSQLHAGLPAVQRPGEERTVPAVAAHRISEGPMSGASIKTSAIGGSSLPCPGSVPIVASESEAANADC